MVASRSPIAQAWRVRSAELAQWTMQYLVNRTDTWAAFLPVKKQKPGRVANRTTGLLGEQALARHYVGQAVPDLIGLPSTGPDRTGRWFAVHVCSPHGGEPDVPGDSFHATPGDNFHATLFWYEKLKTRHIDPILEEDCDGGGYRLFVPLDSPVEVARLCDFAQDLVSDYADHDLYHQPATWPDRSCVEGDGLNNWLRLPGRTPRIAGSPGNVSFSRIWSGSEWLSGEAAINVILATRSTPAAFLHKLGHAAAAPAMDPIEEMPPEPAAPAHPLEPATPVQSVNDEPEVSVEPVRRDAPPDAATEKESPAMSHDTTPAAPSQTPLPRTAEQVVGKIAARTGMREDEIASRIFKWIGEQDEVVQAVILGQIPDAIRPNVWKLILESMVPPQPAADTAGFVQSGGLRAPVQAEPQEGAA